MKGFVRAMPLAAAIALAATVVFYGPTLAGRAAYEVAAGETRAAREQLKEMSSQVQLSRLYRTVAQAVKPSVVVVHVEQKISYAQPQGTPEMDDFFRRFFGEQGPEQDAPRRPRRQMELPRQREYMTRGLGSGAIVDAKNGYIVTNWHVVHDADKVNVILHDNRRLEAEWVKTDAATDLAIIKVKGGELVDVPLGDSDKMEVGDLVMAIGAPEGLPQTVTTGIVSAKGRTTGRGGSYQDFLQTDAAINHGNSGGPLVNMQGEVIGINTAIVSRTGVNEGIGLAIPSNMVRQVMDQLISKGKVVRGYLGVRIQEVDEKLAKSFKLPHMKGALVSQVAGGSPAEKARLQVGDFITAINGKTIETVNDLRNYVASLEANKAYPFTVYRNGEKKTLDVTLTEQPEDMAVAFGDSGGAPSATSTKFGIKVADLTDELAEKYGYKKKPDGVVIVEVKGGSDASDGLREGMVVMQVQDHKTATVADFNKAISAADAKSGVRLHVTTATGEQRFVFVAPEK
jgi:serine protease Do